MNYTEEKFEDHIEKSLNSSGWKSLHYSEYDRNLCQISSELLTFIKESQEKEYEKLTQQYGSQTDDKLCKRVCDEISKRGIVDVLRKGVKDHGSHFQLVYFEPKSGLNPEHQKLYGQNRFTVVRQLHFSPKNENSIDVSLFLNGIPLVTMELKNNLTSQTILDSEKQYRNRDTKELLLQFKRCIVHFCVDNDKVSMTTRIMGSKTKFLPYNKGIENPINPDGHKTHYLWDEVLQPKSVLDILENFVHVSVEIDKEYDKTKGKIVDKKKEILIFPRYHQLTVIRNLRNTIREEGVGHNYLVGHTTGSGKSYSIGWLSHLLTSLYKTKDDKNRMFDTIIVVTDRKVLDQQLQQTIKQLEQTQGVVNPIDQNSKQLLESLEKGKDIIITTIQKFPFISEEIGKLSSKTFGVIVDEVHSSQGGESSKHLKKSLSNVDDQEDDGERDDIDEEILKEIRSRQKQPNISFFGFTGTPKSKTLEVFGRKNDQNQFVPFHSYTMKQSIHEGFTLDVLQSYTTYSRWFKLNKKEVEDKELPKSKVMTELVKFVDSHEVTIQNKVRIILDNFVNNSSKKINGRSRGMVVVRSRLHCVLFYHEMKKQMKEQNLNYSCLVAFSGTVKHSGQDCTEDSLNDLPSGVGIPESLKTPQYRLLIVSSKFQTGFDEPLLHSMYVDKKLGGLQCVQTLSRLNRTMSGKTDTFILDFVNKPEEVYESYQPYFETTVLEGETDPNRLYTVQHEIENFHLFTPVELEDFCKIFFDDNEPDEKLQPILNTIVTKWSQIEERDDREQFRHLIQSFIRLYGYISQIITFEDISLEKLFVFLRYLNKKLPKREKEDLGDIINTVDLDSFRIQKKFEGGITLVEGTILEVKDEGDSKGAGEEEIDLLSEIIKGLNQIHGSELTDEDKLDLENVQKRIEDHKDLKKVFMGDNSESNKKSKFDEVLNSIILSYVNDRFDFYKKMEDPKVKKYINSLMYQKYQSSVGTPV